MKTPTAAQIAASESEHPQILCVAGPGSGKTETLANRVRKLVQRGVDPRRICVITYTNNAARNLEERFLVPDEYKTAAGGVVTWYPEPLGFCGTLHGLGLRMLRKHGAPLGYGERTAVIDDDAAADLLASKAKSMGCKTPLKKLVELKKHGEPEWSGYAMRGRLDTDQLTVAAYFADLRESGLVDFDLILTELARLLGTEPHLISKEFTDLLADEVQDWNANDWDIFRAFPAARKFAVGDSDQAIFAFRGGDCALMTAFAQEPETKTLYLQQNFRCGDAICDAANLLIGNNTGRLIKKTVSATGQTGDVDGMAIAETEGEEIAKVIQAIRFGVLQPNECAVLARTNAIADAFREGLKAAGLPVVEPPKIELPRDWALARALVELAAQPRNETLAMLYMIERSKHAGKSDADARLAAHGLILVYRANKRSMSLLPGALFAAGGPSLLTVTAYMDAQGITRETCALIAKLTRTLPPGADLALEMARFKADEQETTGQGVTCTTIHNAKGREWDVVFLVGFEDEVIPGNRKSDGPEQVEEERRLAFVGITRARHRVVFTSSKTRRANWGRQELQQHTPSRFIGEALS